MGIGIHMLPSNLNLNIGKMKGNNNEILVNNTGMKTGSNRDTNKDRKKLSDMLKAVASADRHDLVRTTIPHSPKSIMMKN